MYIIVCIFLQSSNTDYVHALNVVLQLFYLILYSHVIVELCLSVGSQGDPHSILFHSVFISLISYESHSG